MQLISIFVFFYQIKKIKKLKKNKNSIKVDLKLIQYENF